MSEEKRVEIKEGVIENVGVLNFKDVSPEDLDKIRFIRNVGVIIVPKELMGKVSAISKKNVGAIVPYTEGIRIYSGEITINADTLRWFKKPADILIAGETKFDEDVTPELIDEKINTIRVYGMAFVPAKTYGAFMAKCVEVAGVVKKLEELKEKGED